MGQKAGVALAATSRITVDTRSLPHFYRIDSGAHHLRRFFVEGVSETDGVHYVPVPIGRRYPLGLLVVQNGDAPEPPSTDPVNGFEFDGSTQLKCVDFSETLTALRRQRRYNHEVDAARPSWTRSDRAGARRPRCRG
jgi:hypothetical protein